MSSKTCKASVTVFAFNICRGVEARLCDEKEREMVVSRGYETRGGYAFCVTAPRGRRCETKKARRVGEGHIAYVTSVARED